MNFRATMMMVAMMMIRRMTDPTPTPTPTEQVDVLNTRVIPEQTASDTLTATPINGTTITLLAQEERQQAPEATYTFTAGTPSTVEHGYIQLIYNGSTGFTYDATNESPEAPALIIKTATYMK